MTSPTDPTLPGDRLPRMPRDLESALRREGLRLKDERARGHVPLKVWVGELGADLPAESTTSVPPTPGDTPNPTTVTTALRAPEVTCFVSTPGERLDHHDRAQVVLGLTHLVRPRVPRPRLWLTRSGAPAPCPEDWRWFAASSEAWDALGLEADYAIVTREGWTLLPSGRTRLWRRLRS